MRRPLTFLILTVVLRTSVGFADTHYVSKTGSDIYPYDSWVTAADSIQKGIDAASAGDTVRVAAGTYREMVMMIPGIVLLGAGMDSSIIYPYKNSGRDIVYGQDSSIIEGFHIKGWYPEMNFCVGIRSATDSKLDRIAESKISECDAGIYLGIASTEVSNNIAEDNYAGFDLDIGFTGLVISNTIASNHWGINLFACAHPRIMKNLIIAGPGDTKGIYGDFLDSLFIENNLIVGYEWEAVCIGKYSGQFETAPIRNNTLISDGLYGVVRIALFSNEIKNNIISEGLCGIATYQEYPYTCNPQVSYNAF